MLRYIPIIRYINSVNWTVDLYGIWWFHGLCPLHFSLSLLFLCFKISQWMITVTLDYLLLVWLWHSPNSLPLIRYQYSRPGAVMRVMSAQFKLGTPKWYHKWEMLKLVFSIIWRYLYFVMLEGYQSHTHRSYMLHILGEERLSAKGSPLPMVSFEVSFDCGCNSRVDNLWWW